ncbi:kinase-like protein [Hypoxylon sp. FL0543]|nr:kinase-like protein [Hypoxylon sp. FL0543]
MSTCDGENFQISGSASLTEETDIEYYGIGEWACVEDVDLYNKGGFHPVHIGDVLDERFEVVHKLGHGGFSTVWLCLNTTNQRWRAIKIMTANHSSQGRDITVVNHLLREASLEQLEDCHIAVPQEQFWVGGPNGRHLCFVTDVYGWNAGSWSLFQDPMKEKTAVSINSVCQQIVKALRFLHSKGICHGDLKPGNILMKLRSLDGFTKKQMLELTGEPELVEVETVSGEDPRPHAPRYCVSEVSSEWCDNLITDSAVLGDFGEAFQIENPPKTTGIPELYAAPEILFEGVPGPASDIWSLACTIYEIKTHHMLFASIWGNTTANFLGEIRHFIGPLPEPYKSVYRKQMIAQYGRAPKDRPTEGVAPDPSIPDPDHPCPFKEVLEEERYFRRHVPNSEDLPPEEQEETFIYRYPEEEVSMLADLFKKMLRYDPAERIDIKEVSCHPWFKGTPDDKKLTAESKSIWTLGLSLLSLETFSRYCLPGYSQLKGSCSG